MRIENIKKIKLTADEGMMLTNGTSVCKVAFLAKGDSESNWNEIPEEEAKKIIENESGEENE